MKKNHLLIAALIISLIFGAYNFIRLKDQQRIATELFKFSLHNAQAGFNVNYSKLDENEKMSNFMKASSNLNTALVLFKFTSYANIENHKELTSAISELHSYMIEYDTDSKRFEEVDENSQLILKYLHFLGKNPNDKNSSVELYKLANNLRLNIENIEINYKATSLNWAVDYKIDGNENKHETYYSFKYIGKEEDSVNDVNYSIDSSNEGEDGEFKMSSTRVHTGKLKLTAGLPKSTDRDITFKITWNGKEEILILKQSSP